MNQSLIHKIAQDIKEHNGGAFYVGGYVRDQFLGIESKDIDIEVYGIEIDHLKNILSKYGKVKEVGKSFGILILEGIEFAIPRIEVKNGNGHKGFDIELNPNFDYERACRRRDLTINSILKNVLTGEIIDPYNGQEDIKNKIIKYVDIKSFAEDPLRILRVAQFAARFNFEVHPRTKELCKSISVELLYLSKERIFDELKKLLMKADKPSIGIKFLKEVYALSVLLPELDNLESIEQGNKYHPEGNAFIHTLLVVDAIPREQRTFPLMLAALFHDIGKLYVESEILEDHVTFRGHAEIGEDITRRIMERLTNEKNLIDEVCSLVKYHMFPVSIRNNISKRTIRRLSLKVDIPKLMVLHKADRMLRYTDLSYIDKILEKYEAIKNEIKPIFLGRHLIELGYTPGAYFGKILKDVYEKQLDGKILSVEKAKKYVEQTY